VLASRSPQRRALLGQLGIPFRERPSEHAEETVPGDPVATAERNARGKAVEVLGRVRLGRGELVLGVDTIVVAGSHILGKAVNESEALRYLERLQGRTHDVVSGLCLCDSEREYVAHAVTEVTFRGLDTAALRRYVARGEWRQRAGAYAIQGFGSALVESVRGDYFNVVGLPVALLLSTLATFGVQPFSWLSAGNAAVGGL
jgi:septum formation protein